MLNIIKLKLVKIIKLSPIEIKIDGNKMVSDLAKYQKIKHYFIVDGLLFSSVISNDANTNFITASGLNDAKKDLSNNKLHKTLGLINLTNFNYWNLVNGKSNWINVNIINSEYIENSFFGFGFITKNQPVY